MIREMRKGEEHSVRTLLAKLGYEDQILWHKRLKSFEECLQKSNAIRIGSVIKGAR